MDDEEAHPAQVRWRRSERPLADIAQDVLTRTPIRPPTRVVAVDSGSAAGKSTFAGRLAAVLDAPVVHTDDLAWHHGFFDWWPLLIDGVLRPLAAGRAVSYRPPAWDRRGRSGSVEARPGPAVVVEGVGSARRELAGWIDFVVWVDSDRQRALVRGLAREGEDPAFWREWERAEEAHLDADRPWERADLIVSADPPEPVDAQHVVVTTEATWQRAARPQDPRLP